jgi:hypothetical protein
LGGGAAAATGATVVGFANMLGSHASVAKFSFQKPVRTHVPLLLRTLRPRAS